MEDEFIIINKTAIQQKIEELEKEYILLSNKSDRSLSDIEEEREIVSEQRALAKILSQSTPLIPEIEKTFDIGSLKTEQCYNKTNGFVSGIIHTDKQDYISNLKLDI